MRDESYVGSSDVLLPFLLGAATGAALALLYAPYSGRQTRELIKDGIARGTERTKEIRDRVVGRGREILDQASDAVERGRERLGAAVEAGREAFREEKAAMTGSMPSRS
jgi:gas vesicle protein